jgi:peptidoglycan/LPS O-acetylase OafA/YrhL
MCDRTVPATRLGGLDGLRALAALAVFGVHWSQIVRVEARLGPFDLYRLLANGNHGVSLFFTLSGFLLALPYWRAMEGGTPLPGIRAFAIRRIVRIVPAYYLVLTILVVLGGLAHVPAAHADIALHYLFLFNFTEFSIFSINPAFWTLAVEMQFYLLLPFVFVMLRRIAHRFRVAAVVGLAAGAYGLQFAVAALITKSIPWPGDPALCWVDPHRAVLSHSLLAHLPHFLLGVLGAAFFLKRAVRPAQADALFWTCAVAVLILLSTPLGDRIQMLRGRYGLPLVPGLIAVIVVSAPSTRIAQRLLTTRPLRLLGLTSYGFYIWHIPCLLWVDRTMLSRDIDAPEHPLTFGALAFLLTVLVAAISFVAIERPILRSTNRRARRGAV